MKNLRAAISNMNLAKQDLTSCFLTGRFKGVPLEKYSTVASRELAYALHVADSAAFHIAVQVVKSKQKTTPKTSPGVRPSRPGRNEVVKQRNEINSYFMAVNRMLFGTKPEVTHVSKRPYVTVGLNSVAALSATIKEALPIIVEHQTRNTDSIEHVILKPIIDLLKEAAWTLTCVNSYKNPTDLSKCKFSEGRTYVLKHYPAEHNPDFRKPLPPAFTEIEKEVQDILVKAIPDITETQEDSWRHAYRRGDLINLGSTLYRCRRGFVLKQTKYKGIIKESTEEALLAEDIKAI